MRRGIFHGDAGAGSILGRGSLGNMHVQVAIGMEICCNTKARCTTSHYGQRSLDRLLHNVSQRSGFYHFSGSWHRGSLDGKQLATYRGPGQAIGRLHEGLIGRVYFAQCWYNNARESIGLPRVRCAPRKGR